jgi:hypothetical protein
LSLIDRLLVGKVIEDLGVFYERASGRGKENHRGLLVEWNHRYWFVVKSRYPGRFGGSLSYARFPLESADRVRELLSQSQRIVQKLLLG